MMILIIVGVLAALILFYVLEGRTWLKTKPWAQKFFRVVEPFELFLFDKSETILYARVKQVIALLLAVLPQIGAFDVASYIVLVPERHRWWVMLIPSLALAVDGIVTEIQRRYTTKPLALVALPDAMSLKVDLAVARADAFKEEAVAAVEEAKEAGTL